MPFLGPKVADRINIDDTIDIDHRTNVRLEAKILAVNDNMAIAEVTTKVYMELNKDGDMWRCPCLHQNKFEPFDKV
ncbi:MAG: hypothetical protein CMB80_00430 [Flammeovirgaceae bacterium]|jgi:hypothetical protein|nr:hypothetical protein [Flammeovirgaceae bacterium]|tara:strand:- start:1336 stop:1563 length:228 start_codon:yes stop_codon:yes gene_type:complete